MAVKVLPQTVADAFVKQYYTILNRCPEKAHKFYQEPSILGWPGPDGVMTSVTSLSGINDKIMSSAYKHCTAEIKTRDAQESLDGGIIIAVTGLLTGKDNVTKNFCQTFFLAKQEKGFYVLNDILQFTNVADTAADIKDLSAPSVQNSDNNTVIEDGKKKEAFDHSISEDTAAKGTSSTPNVAPEEKASPVVAQASEEKVLSAVAPASNKKARSAAKASKKKVRSAVTQNSNKKARSAVAPALNENLPEAVAPALTENLPEVIASKKKVQSAVAPDSNEKVHSAVTPDSNEKARLAIAPALNENSPEVFALAVTENLPEVIASKEKVHSAVTLDLNEKVHSAVAPALNENLPEVVAQALTESLPEVIAPASTENLPEVAAPASTGDLPAVFAVTSNEKETSAGAPASDEKAHSTVVSASDEQAPSVAARDSNVPSVAAPDLTGDLPAVVAATSNEKETSTGAPASDEKAHSTVVLASDEQTPSVVATDSNVPSVAAPSSIVTKKITYASVVAKEAPAASPRTIRVVTNVNKQRAPSPIAKVSAPAGKDANKIDVHAEGTGIYIGRLPYNITKQGLIDVLQKFGPVRRTPDNIQIRRHKDGFCCGFVEFESADAVRRAVQAHRVKFGGTEAYIAFKRSSAYRGNEAGGKSQTGAGNFNGQDDNRTNTNKARSGHH